MSKETEAALKRIATFLGIVLGVITLTAAIKTGGEMWLVPWRVYQQDLYDRGLARQRDSTFQLRVIRWMDAQDCKDYCAANPNERPCACLRPDRP